MKIKYLIAGLFGLVIAGALSTVALYASRFWTLRLWGREGLFEEKWLHPAGGILRRQLSALLRGSGFGELNAFDVVLWGLAIFLILTILHYVFSKILGLFGRGGAH